MPTTSISTSSRISITYCVVLLVMFFVPALLILEEKAEAIVVVPPVLPEPLPVVMPDFDEILDVQEKKQTFFDFLEPFVDQVNAEIISERQRVLAIQETVVAGAEVPIADLRYLLSLSEKYEIETNNVTSPEFFELLLRRVDKIPASLALAQAANESAWGTSRFAQNGNNLFGVWCYSTGCGIVPNRRREGATHEVRRYENVRDSVEAYIHNLNTFPSYLMLRRIRERLRDQNRPLDGATLADGLESYSARGLDYINEVQSMIYSNNLLDRDNPSNDYSGIDGLTQGMEYQ